MPNYYQGPYTQDIEGAMFNPDAYDRGLADSYRRRALGIGVQAMPELSTLNAGIQGTRNMQASAAAGQRGISHGTSARMAMQMGGDAQVQGAQQAQILQQQDREAAMQQWSAYEQLRAQKDAFRQEMLLGKHNIDEEALRRKRAETVAGFGAIASGIGGLMGGMGG